MSYKSWPIFHPLEVLRKKSLQEKHKKFEIPIPVSKKENLLKITDFETFFFLSIIKVSAKFYTKHMFTKVISHVYHTSKICKTRLT